MVASGGVLSEGYGHGGPDVCLGDGQTEAYLKDTDMTGLASAWAMARWRLKEYRHKVDAATRCSSVCLHTSPDKVIGDDLKNRTKETLKRIRTHTAVLASGDMT